MDNRNADGLLEIVREKRPDVLLAVETDTWWESRLETLAPEYPFALKHPLENYYGMHLYSRIPLEDAEVRYLVEDETPSMFAGLNLPTGVRVDLHCAHPAPPSPTENPTAVERDAELVLVAREVQRNARPAIVIGDLNDVAWSATTRLFQKISGLLDPRIGRGMFSTYHASHPWLRWPLDHVFASSEFTLVCFERLRHFGSDHFPIFAALRYAPAARRLHVEPEATEEDERLADEKVDKVTVEDGGAANRAPTTERRINSEPSDSRLRAA